MSDHPICPLPHRHEPERPRRTSEGTRICAGHLRGMIDDLDDLAALHDELADYLIGSGGGPGDRTTTETGISLNPNVVRARDHIRATLVSWTLIVLEEGPSDHGPEDTIPAMSTWLTCRFDWLTHQDWTPELATNLRETRNEARALVQPDNAYRMELGPCPELVGEVQAHCTGTVIAVMRRASSREQLPSVVKCTAYGDDPEEPHLWSPMQWHALGRRMGRSMHESAAEAFLRAVSGESG